MGIASGIGTSSGGGSGAMTLLGTATVTGSAATTLTVSGLDLSAYKGFEVRYSLANAHSGYVGVSLYYNSDTTATNYYRQTLNLDNTTVTATRTNDGFATHMGAINEDAVGTFRIAKDGSGRPRMEGSACVYGESTIRMLSVAHVRNNTDNVTSITLSASVANSLAVGSTFTVYGIS